MDLGNLFRQILFGQASNSGDPQAYTRVTHTPVYWGQLPGDTYGQYSPATRDITLNSAKLPQVNPSQDEMSNILRHEQVHALLPPSTVDAISKYFQANPGQASQGQSNLANIDPDAARSVHGLAQEAPAYAVQGRQFGLPSSTLDEYLSRMPDPIRRKYLQLFQAQSQATPGGGR